MSVFRSVPFLCVVCLAILIGVGLVIPQWAMFLTTMALAKGLVALGIVCLMRVGLVSFGQGLYFCLGAYVSGLMAKWTGVSDIFLLCFLGVITAVFIAGVCSPLLSRYRGIFFAMLTLSLSMILYGSLSKTSALGGTDGLNVIAPTFLGFAPEGRELGFSLYAFTCCVVVIAGGFIRVFFNSEQGLVSLAIRNNELRVDYLGASVRRVISINYVFAAVLGSVGGVIAGLAIGHVDPEYAYWTTSGEFVFVAILSGYLSIAAVFVASIVLEVVRSFSNLYFPNTWQLALGVFLLLVILLLPNGLGSLVSKRKSSGSGK